MSTAVRPNVDRSFVLRSVAQVLLPLWFAIYAALTALNLYRHGFLFMDVAVYRDAAIAAVNGGNPWTVGPLGDVTFAGPPPTLLFALPLAFMPLEAAIIATTAVLAVAAVWSVRRLHLPLWWLLFPPIFECLLVGNLDVLVLAFLLVDGPLAGLAAVAKVYGAVPLLLQRRWPALILAGLISLVTVPLWAMFFENLGLISLRLDQQAEGFSAWGTWWIIPTVLALWVLRRRGAEWLVVPGLWPSTQIHYAAMSLPAIHRFPIPAAIIGLASPLAPVIAIVIMAIQVRFRIGPTNPDPAP